MMTMKTVKTPMVVLYQVHTTGAQAPGPRMLGEAVAASFAHSVQAGCDSVLLSLAHTPDTATHHDSVGG